MSKSFLRILFLLIIGVGVIVGTASFISYQSSKNISATTTVVNTTRIQIPIVTLTTSASSTATATSTTQATPLRISALKPAKVISPVTVTVSAPVAQPVLTTAPAPTIPSISFDTINTSVRAAVVNIICTTRTSGPFSPISGSGVIISPDGVIITNAHVAEYLLLKDFNGQPNYVDCVIRTGSPAYPAYKASLVYISPQWVKDNTGLIIASDPTGTGEHDYAFLKITSRADGGPLPGSPIPYVSPDTMDDTRIGDNMLLASYPAGFLGGIAIIKDLYQTSAIAQVSDVFTFNKDTIDVISVPGTVVSQRGSSGGASVNAQGKLAGIISTSSSGDTTGSRDLRAITLSYINRDLIEQNNMSIGALISNADTVGAQFNKDVAPQLTGLLTNVILGQ